MQCCVCVLRLMTDRVLVSAVKCNAVCVLRLMTDRVLVSAVKCNAVCLLRLMTDRVLLSSAECNAVVSSLMECSRFCLSRCLSSDPDDLSLCDFVVSHIVSSFLSLVASFVLRLILFMSGLLFAANASSSAPSHNRHTLVFLYCSEC